MNTILPILHLHHTAINVIFLISSWNKYDTRYVFYMYYFTGLTYTLITDQNVHQARPLQLASLHRYEVSEC